MRVPLPPFFPSLAPTTMRTNAPSPSSTTSHCSKCSHCHPKPKTPKKVQDRSNASTISISASRSTGRPKHLRHAAIAPRQVTFADDPHRHIPYQQLSPLPARAQTYPQLSGPGFTDQPMQMPIPMQMPVPMPMAMMPPHEPRLHPFAPAPVLHNLGRGPEPLFGWESVMPLNHAYGQPKYIKRVKPDYRRFCFSVGKADVPFAAMPGGPLWGMDVTMAPQMVGSHRW
jgi:hypothetical protein